MIMPRKWVRLSVLFLAMTGVLGLTIIYMNYAMNNFSRELHSKKRQPDPEYNEEAVKKVLRDNGIFEDGYESDYLPIPAPTTTVPPDNTDYRKKYNKTAIMEHYTDMNDDDAEDFIKMNIQYDKLEKIQNRAATLLDITTTTTTATPTTTETPTTTAPTPTTTTPTPTSTTPAPPLNKFCYMKHDKNFNKTIDYLEDIQSAKKQPSPLGKNIFFHETSCTTDGLVRLKSRQACAIESAAKTNPTMNVFVLFASHVGFKKNEPKSEIIQSLFKYPNVYFRHVDIWSYVNDTIPEAKTFIETGTMFESQFMLVHTADFLRILSLYRYGGSHFDLDFIVRKDLSEILPNYLCEEISDVVNNGFMNFAPDGMGHHVVQECLLEFSTNYKRDEWGFNGPMLLTRLIKRLCKVEHATLCPWFRVFPPPAFCPLYYGNLGLLFEEKLLKEATTLTNDAIAIHCWNALTAKMEVKVGSNVGYGKFAEQFCPKVYGSCGEYF